MAFEAIFESTLQQVKELEAYCLPRCNFWPNPKTAKVYHISAINFVCRICLSNFLSVVRVNICFQSTGTGKYATLVTRHLNFQHTPLVISYIQPHGGLHYSPSNPTVHFGSLLANSAWFNSGKKAAINGAYY